VRDGGGEKGKEDARCSPDQQGRSETRHERTIQGPQLEAEEREEATERTERVREVMRKERNGQFGCS
jgi:hypothetical protein